MSNDLAYLLLENASRSPIRAHNDLQLTVIQQLVAEGHLHGNPGKGYLVITKSGRAQLSNLKAVGAARPASVELTMEEHAESPVFSQRGRGPGTDTLEKRIAALTAEVSRLEKIADVRRGVNQRLVKTIHHLNAKAGSDVHIAALQATIAERDEMIKGLRQTIERLRAERNGRD